MARNVSAENPTPEIASLVALGRGELLGVLDRRDAERAYLLYRDRQVESILWTGEAIEATLRHPPVTVSVSATTRRTGLEVSCTQCGARAQPCSHAATALLRWIDVRPTMLRKGPGTLWRSRARQPFIVLPGKAEEKVDLSHLTGMELRSALELQLSLGRSGRASAALVNGEVRIKITLPSGGARSVVFSAAVLPSALPVLRTLPRLELDPELAELEISEARLRPILKAAWEGDNVLLEPGYRLVDGTFLPLEEAGRRALGRWVRLGRLLCRPLDPDTPLLPFFRVGRKLLRGREVLRFLTLDHPLLTAKPWYFPEGALGQLSRATAPAIAALQAEEDEHGVVHLRPRFSAAGIELKWEEILHLLKAGFLRRGDLLLQAPDLQPLERAGFTLDRRSQRRGLRGSRTAFLRLVAESDAPIEAAGPSLARVAALLRGEATLQPIQPSRLRSQLRPYQREGTAWLWSRYETGIGALLADDMGLGKTHQVMALLTLVQEQRAEARSLVVCPRGVMEHWLELLERYAPHLRAYLFHGTQRSLEDVPEGTALVLTTYDIVVRSRTELQELDWEVVVFDEAQRIKNPRTKAARAARKLSGRHRVALTGTPLENRLVELWSVVDLITPGYLGSEREFRATYRSPDRDQLTRLRRRLGALTLRRVKEQVLTELPEKVEDLRYCRLTQDQQELYKRVHSQGASSILDSLADPGADIPYIHIFALLTRLKQVCDHPDLLSDGGGRPGRTSAKLPVFDEILDEALASGQQVVVYTQYVKMIDLLSRHLRRRRVAHLQLTGATRERGRLIRRFNSGQHEPVLLASLLAGGVGIDLTGASVVIHYDRWWNPAREDQATDRVHRIGQHRFVQVFKLVTRDTVEERIDRIIRSKLDLMAQVVTPTEHVLRSFTRRELAELLDLPVRKEV